MTLPSMRLAAAIATTALLTAACMTPPANLDLSTRHDSAHRQFVVAIEPQDALPPMNQMHAWLVRVATPDGAPVSHASISFAGGMPGHGHGYPSKPRVTRETAPGVYVLEGVKFSMPGWWDMRLGIDANGVSDTAVFNLMVDSGGKRAL